MASVAKFSSLPPGRINGQFSKTRLCRFEQLGICVKGLQCPFAHGGKELKDQPDLRCTKLCKQLLTTGYCDIANCPYAHRREELRATGGKAAGAQSGQKSQKARRSKTDREQHQKTTTPPPGLEEFAASPSQPNSEEDYARALAAVLGALPSTLPSSVRQELGMKWLAILAGASNGADVASSAEEPFSAKMEPAYIKSSLSCNSDGTSSTGSGEELLSVGEELASSVLDEPIQDFPLDSYFPEYGYVSAEEQAQWAGWNLWGAQGSWGEESYRPDWVSQHALCAWPDA